VRAQDLRRVGQVADAREGSQWPIVASELIRADADIRALLLVVELGDRVIDLASREGNEPDQTIIELGRSALRAYVEQEFPEPR
jgi:hypothetical protein